DELDFSSTFVSKARRKVDAQSLLPRKEKGGKKTRERKAETKQKAEGAEVEGRKLILQLKHPTCHCPLQGSPPPRPLLGMKTGRTSRLARTIFGAQVGGLGAVEKGEGLEGIPRGDRAAWPPPPAFSEARPSPGQPPLHPLSGSRDRSGDPKGRQSGCSPPPHRAMSLPCWGGLCSLSPANSCAPGLLPHVHPKRTFLGPSLRGALCPAGWLRLLVLPANAEAGWPQAWSDAGLSLVDALQPLRDPPGPLVTGPIIPFQDTGPWNWLCPQPLLSFGPLCWGFLFHSCLPALPCPLTTTTFLSCGLAVFSPSVPV
ncbi:hypothetical protein E2320_007375, partial [Naja naja]